VAAALALDDKKTAQRHCVAGA